MKKLKLLIFVFLGIISVRTSHSQISDFSASHVPGSMDIQISFYFDNDGSQLGVPEFSISTDRGINYRNLVKTFESKASPSRGIVPGPNRYIWKAGNDLPGVYVDPAFLRMKISVARDNSASVLFQNESIPSVRVIKPLPAFEVVKFIAGKVNGYFASSSDVMVKPGTYTGKTLEDLLSRLDPNVWSPVSEEDEETIPDRPNELQDGKAVPPTDRDNLKFDGKEIVYSDLPEVGKGQPIISTEFPRDIKGITDTGEPQKPMETQLEGNTLFVRFLLFQDRVTYGGSRRFNGQITPNFSPVINSGEPIEPGSTLLDEQGTVWERGDYIVGFYNTKGLYDISIIKRPLEEIAHDAKGEHRLGVNDRGSFGADVNLVSDLQQVVVWKAEVSNSRLPLGNLRQLETYTKSFLSQKLVVSAKEVLRFDEIPRRQSPTNNPPLEKIWNSGPKGDKYNVVITGDGFANTDTDNQKMLDWLEDHLFNGMLSADIQPSYMNAVNFYFLDAKSAQSGITKSRSITIPKEDIGDYTGRDDYLWHKSANDDQFFVYLINGTRRNTAWDLASADWEACWRIPMEGFGGLTSAVLNKFGGKPDEIWVVTNDGAGGCAGSSDGIKILTIDESRPVGTLLHEWGHTFGGLSDEYTRNKPYSSGADGKINLFEASAWNGTRAGLKSNWKKWIPSWRPVPTTSGDIAIGDTDVGLFLGGFYSTNGVYRPVLDGRMNSNSPLNSPVGNTAIRNKAYGYREQNFRENFLVDANNDGLTDLIVQDDRQIGLYLSADRNVGPDDPVTGQPPRGVTGVLEPTWFATDILRSNGRSWEFRKKDNLATGDFSGDGNHDIIVQNGKSWNIPYIGLLRSTGNSYEVVRRYDGNLNGWQMRSDDRVQLADFDGDGRMEMTIFNGKNWSMPYLGIYRINDNNQLVFLQRFDKYLPGWEMGRNEKFQFCDVNGDGRDDIVAMNQSNWSKAHIHVYVSQGNGSFSLKDRYYGKIDNGITWNINRKDKYFFGDWNGDKICDFGIFNGKSFTTEFLGLFRFNGQGKMSGLRLHSDSIPGWNFQANDVIKPFDKNGDSITDMVVFNAYDWGDREYLGILSNNGQGSLSGRWQEGWIGGWNLGSVDKLKVVDFRGGSEWDDLFIFNKNWFGMLRGQKTHFSLEAIYYRWIQNQRYHQNSLY